MRETIFNTAALKKRKVNLGYPQFGITVYRTGGTLPLLPQRRKLLPRSPCAPGESQLLLQQAWYLHEADRLLHSVT
jgi:hypothetical protein